jgi:hypothetical protein
VQRRVKHVKFRTTSTLFSHLRRTSITARVRNPTNHRRWHCHERGRRPGGWVKAVEGGKGEEGIRTPVAEVCVLSASDSAYMRQHHHSYCRQPIRVIRLRVLRQNRRRWRSFILFLFLIEGV